MRANNPPWTKTWQGTLKDALINISQSAFINTLKPRYNEPWYSELFDIVNKTQLPFWGFTKYITFDIVNYSI